MSRTVVGYEGEGRRRRAIYRDHGPANGAGAGDALGSHAQVARIAHQEASRLVEVGGRMPDGGAGTIERSMASEAQREAWRAAERVPSPIAPIRQTEAERLAHFHRGGERNRALRAADKPVTPNPQEEPVMAIEPPPVTAEPETAPASLGTRIAVVAEAAAAASDAWSELQMAAEAERAAEAALAAAEARWDDARASLEASWRSTGIGSAVGPPVSEAERRHVALLEQPYSPVELGSVDVHGSVGAANFDAAVQAAFAGSGVEVRTSFTPTDDVVDVPEPVAASPDPGWSPAVRLSRQQERALAAALKHGGDFKAIAEEIGSSRQNARLALEAVGRKGALPIDLIARLPAGFAKYTGV